MTEHTALWTTETEKAHKELEAAGVKFNDVDSAAFQTALKPLVEKYVTTDSAKKIYDAARAAAN